MKTLGQLILCIVAGYLLTGCSSGYSSSPPDYSSDLAEMKERILELQEQATVADVEIKRLRQQVSTLESRFSGEVVTTEMAERVVVENAPSTGSLGTATPDPVVALEVEESDLEAEELVVETAALQPSEDSAAPAPQIESPAVTTTLAPVDSAGQALYDRGYTLYHQGRYLDAEATFQRFLQAHPLTELSDNAQFWIGESRYARGDIRGALAAFRETLQGYPNGNKVPDALIKEGDCLTSLGDRDGARERYEEVNRRFPSSAAAVMATERLAALD